MERKVSEPLNFLIKNYRMNVGSGTFSLLHICFRFTSVANMWNRGGVLVFLVGNSASVECK